MDYGVRDRLLDGDRTRLLAGVGAIVLVLAPFLLPSFQLFLLSEVLVFGIFATAFNLLYGYTGLLSFGHAMFVAVSGYTSAQFVLTVAPALGFESIFGGANPLALLACGVIVGTTVTAMFSVPIGYLSVRLQEIYFAMITLSFSMAVYVMAQQDTVAAILDALPGVNVEFFTNGSDGLSLLLGTANVFGLRISLIDPGTMYFLILLVFVPTMYALWRIVRSPFGMVCRAVRENPERAEAIGIDVTRHSWATFVLSGTFSGLAGALLIPLRTSIIPGIAHWSFSAEPVIMTVIGGPYSFLGPLVGAFTYEYLRWGISQFPALEAYWQFTFGFLILLVVLFFDEGVVGFLQWLREQVGERGATATTAAESESPGDADKQD